MDKVCPKCRRRFPISTHQCPTHQVKLRLALGALACTSQNCNYNRKGSCTGPDIRRVPDNCPRADPAAKLAV